MLVSLSWVFPVRPPFPWSKKGKEYSTLFPCLLLVCDDSFDGKPNCLLPHEPKVCNESIHISIILLSKFKTGLIKYFDILIFHTRFRRYYRYVLTLKCLKPSKRDAPAGMFLASAFGLQVAAQLAYGAPAHGCPRHRSSHRGPREERAPLFRSNTVQYEGPGLVMNDRYPMNDRNMLSPQQRQHQSFYEASYRR